MDYDVVVVGAGPAGSSTAYHLATRDVRVLLLDKAPFPREKICGDGIAPRAVRTLYKMGLQERLDGRFNKFHGFSFAGAGRSVVRNPIPPTPRFPDHGYIIRRVDLDSDTPRPRARERRGGLGGVQGDRPAGRGRPRHRGEGGARGRGAGDNGAGGGRGRRCALAARAGDGPSRERPAVPRYLHPPVLRGRRGHRRLPRGLPGDSDKPGERMGVPGDARRWPTSGSARCSTTSGATASTCTGSSRRSSTIPRTSPRRCETPGPYPRVRGALLRVGLGGEQGRVPGDDTGGRRRQHDQPGERRGNNLRARDRRDGRRAHPRQPHERPRLPPRPRRGLVPGEARWSATSTTSAWASAA